MLEKPFALGETVITPGASEALKQYHCLPVLLLIRHQLGDWGDLSDEDKAANDWAVQNQDSVLSVHRIEDRRIWIVTEGDRSSTTILLAEEY